MDRSTANFNSAQSKYPVTVKRADKVIRFILFFSKYDDSLKRYHFERKLNEAKLLNENIMIQVEEYLTLR